MLVALWIINAVLALLFLAAGGVKLIRTREALAESGLPWATEFSSGAVKGIGLAEVLAAFGLILPLLTGIAPILTPLAAVGLVIVMIGAVVLHARRKESIVAQLGLGALAAVSAVLGFMHVLG